MTDDSTAAILVQAAALALSSMKPDTDGFGREDEIFRGNLGLEFRMRSGNVFKSVVKVSDKVSGGTVEIEYGGHDGSHKVLIVVDEIESVSYLKNP